MSIKLCLLRNGDTCIADVKEMLDPNEDVSAGYLLCDPFKLSTVEDNRKTLVGEDKTFAEQEQSRRIAFSRLFSLSNDRNFSVAHEFVDVIYTPHKNLEETYIDIVAAWVQENVREIDLEGSVTIHSNEMDEDEKNRLDSTIENSLFNTQPEYEV